MTVTKTKPSERPPRHREIKERMQPVSRSRLSEEGGGEADGMGELEQTRQKVSYRTVLNTCLSFLNGCKNRYDCNGTKGN